MVFGYKVYVKNDVYFILDIKSFYEGLILKVNEMLIKILYYIYIFVDLLRIVYYFIFGCRELLI